MIGARLRQCAARVLVWSLYRTTLLVADALQAIRGPRPALTGKTALRVLVIGTFFARNWCRAHLQPLAEAGQVERVLAVVDGPTDRVPGVEYLPAPRWLRRVAGRSGAKLLWGAWVAYRRRVHVVMGYHLVPCGLVALVIARLCGARAAYQLTGGDLELHGGGCGAENCVLRRLGPPSPRLERLAAALASRFDLLLVRGRRAAREIRGLGVTARAEIIPAGIDLDRFAPGPGARTVDLISVCRLAEIKQPWQMLEILAELHRRVPGARLAIVGDGPLRPALEARARELGLAEYVAWTGHLDDVAAHLRAAKVFLLTSRSEGLSIAMAEAMAAGVVPIVADVGELGELVTTGQTGALVPPGAIACYAQHAAELLLNPGLREQMSRAARDAVAAHNGLPAIRARWSAALRNLQDAGRTPGRRALLPPGLRRRLWQRTPPPIRRLATPLLHRVSPERLLGHDFRRRLAFLQEAEGWPAERLRAYQLGELRRVCALAAATPFYAAQLAAAALHPGQITTFDDFARLPTIDAETVRANLEHMCTRPADAPGVDVVTTGGTGGRPLQLRMGADRSAPEYAYLVASWARAGYRPDLPLAVFRGEVVPPDRRGLRHAYDPLLRRHAYSNFHTTDADLRRYLEHLATIGPCYLLVYPSSAAALARAVLRLGCAPPANVRGVLAGSEILYPADRVLVEQVFEVRCFSWYGHTEKAVLAAECEYVTDDHVWPTYGYCELLDDAGRPVRTPGQRGEIVATGFIDSVTPLLRYRTGDHATFVGEHCPACGRAHLLLRDIRGHRTQEQLVLADGGRVSWTALNMHDGTFDCVRQFQFRQEQPGVATLRIVPAGGFDEAARARVLGSLGRKLEGRLRLELELTDAIPLTPRGKATYVDQRIAGSAVEEA